MGTTAIEKLEKQILELNAELVELRKANGRVGVKNYRFATPEGEVSLLDLFGGQERLLVIHNMGQGCRYCTLWADGFNGFVSHLESAMALVLVSKDAPEVQRRFANSRGWRFRLASHGGGEYMAEQIGDSCGEDDNGPGAVVYEREGEKIFRWNSCEFGPGDLYCSMWSLLALAGMDEDSWVPQYGYWTRPEKMDDGGQGLNDCCE